MDHAEWVKRRKTIKARMHVVEQYLLDDDECDCTPDLRITDEGSTIIIERGHERFCRIIINDQVASIEAGLKIDRLFKQIGDGLATAQDRLNDAPHLANFHARRAQTLLVRARDLAERHGHDVPEGWDVLRDVLADLERETD